MFEKKNANRMLALNQIMYISKMMIFFCSYGVACIWTAFYSGLTVSHIQAQVLTRTHKHPDTNQLTKEKKWHRLGTNFNAILRWHSIEKLNNYNNNNSSKP